MQNHMVEVNTTFAISVGIDNFSERGWGYVPSKSLFRSSNPPPRDCDSFFLHRKWP